MSLNTSWGYNRLLQIGDLEPHTDGECVIYVMSREQRVQDNFALSAAQKYALSHKLPLAVAFTVVPAIASRAQEHFDFMITGLKEVEENLLSLNVPFILTFGTHIDTVTSLAHHTKPAVLFTDFSPLKGTRTWQEELAKIHPVIVVDSHNIVPVWRASQKQEYAARTIRPKIHALLNDYMQPPDSLVQHPYAWPGTVMKMGELSDRIDGIRSTYIPNGTQAIFESGEAAAQKQLDTFLSQQLYGYAEQRNDPTLAGLSNMSPYLHFGQTASQSVVRAVQEAVAVTPALQKDAEALIEEMVVRKELSDNYCYYNQNYTSLGGAPEWAQKTLQKHEDDTREFIYIQKEFEDAKTHDLAWNAAQLQLRIEGKIHGYMRMYWAKKVLEWSVSPEDALKTLLYLNDFYSIDGGDPNGYVGILWSIAGLHDRPWGERAVYGTVRSMVYGGLKRKFAIEKYIKNYS